MYQKHPIVVFWSVKCFVVGCCISRHNDFLRKQGSPSSSLPSIHEYYSSNPIKSSCTTYTDIRCYSHPNVLCGVRASHSLPTRIARLVGNIATPILHSCQCYFHLQREPWFASVNSLLLDYYRTPLHIYRNLTATTLPFDTDHGSNNDGTHAKRETHKSSLQGNLVIIKGKYARRSPKSLR